MINETLLSVIQNTWPMLVVFIIILIVVRLFKMRNSTADFCLYKEIFNLLFIIYILLLYDLAKANGSIDGINLVPFTNIAKNSLSISTFFKAIIYSIAIFIPFGYFASSYVKAKKIGSIFIIVLITSTAIELVGLKSFGSFNIDDIILNVVGGILGFLLFIALSAIKKHLPGLFQKDFIYNLISIVIVAMIVMYFLKLYGIWWF